jgi:hypothetical protein
MSGAPEIALEGAAAEGRIGFGAHSRLVAVGT